MLYLVFFGLEFKKTFVIFEICLIVICLITAFCEKKLKFETKDALGDLGINFEKPFSYLKSAPSHLFGAKIIHKFGTRDASFAYIWAGGI